MCSLLCLLLLRHIGHVLFLRGRLRRDELSFMVGISIVLIGQRCNLVSTFTRVQIASSLSVLLSVPFASDATS